MKKILNISVIAALAVLPLAASATNGDIVAGNPTGRTAQGVNTTIQTDEAVTASASPKYALAVEGDNDGKVATAGYVKGAYNAAIKAINRVSETASNALTADGEATLTNKTIDADDNTISDLELDNFKSGVVVGSTTGMATGNSASDSKILTEKAVAEGIAAQSVHGVKVNGTGLTEDASGDVNVTIASGTGNGTIAVNGSDVSVTGLGTAAFVNTGDIAGTAGTYDDTTSQLGATTIQGAIGALDTAIDNFGNTYATRTGAAATAAAAVNGATIDFSAITATTGNVGGSATIPVVATWGTDALAANPIAVDLSQTQVVTGLSGNTAQTGKISAGTVSYTAN